MKNQPLGSFVLLKKADTASISVGGLGTNKDVVACDVIAIGEEVLTLKPTDRVLVFSSALTLTQCGGKHNEYITKAANVCLVERADDYKQNKQSTREEVKSLVASAIANAVAANNAADKGDTDQATARSQAAVAACAAVQAIKAAF